MPQQYDFTVGDLIVLIKEHASLLWPSHQQPSLRVVSWHVDTGKVVAAVLANRVGNLPGGAGSTSTQNVQNRMLYRTEVQGQTADALRGLLRGLEGMTRQKFGTASAGSVV